MFISLFISGLRCLADLFEKYLNALSNRGFFFRRPLKDGLRYSEAVVGINKLKTFVSTMFKRAGIEGNFTNHSGKRTCATMLFDAGIDEQEIMSRTGHCSEKGLRQYQRATPSLIARTSVVLDPPQCPAKRIKTETVICTETCAGNPGKDNDSKEETVREPLSNLTNLGASFHNCVFHFGN